MTPSPAIVRWAALVPPGGTVLDVAAGGGRHARLFAARGHRVVAVDRDVAALRAIGEPRIEIVQADLEGAAWPLPGRTFAGVVVVNWLWRPVLPTLVAAVAPGGVLLYETFAVGHEAFGRPRNPDFLLQPGELLDAVRGALEVREYAHGPEGSPPTATRQRLCAVRVLQATASPAGSAWDAGLVLSSFPETPCTARTSLAPPPRRCSSPCPSRHSRR